MCRPWSLEIWGRIVPLGSLGRKLGDELGRWEGLYKWDTVRSSEMVGNLLRDGI